MKQRSMQVKAAGAAIAVLWIIGVGVAARGRAPESVMRNPPTPRRVVPPRLAAQATSAVQKTPMAEDVFKNIQVLKGTTADEFMGTMGLMSAALGYCCVNCHTGAGTQYANWADDTIREKRVARRMVEMVQAINKANFNGRQVVTCWTCHRGRDLPVMTPPLDTVYSEPKVELDDVLAKAPGVPSVDALLDKYYAAIGGADKVAGVKSVAAAGKSTFFGGLGGGAQVELYAQAPDKRAIYIHFPDDPDRGDSTRTFDGKTGWIATPLSVLRKYEVKGGELDGARLDAELMFPAQIRQALTNLRVGPPTEVLERNVYVVQGNGARNTLANLYFDTESGLLVRVVRLTPSAIGRVPTQTDYSDYRDVNGIKMPHHVKFTWLDGVDNIDLTDIKLNTSIPAEKFGEPNPGGKTYGDGKPAAKSVGR